MGYMRHHAIVVTTYNQKHLTNARDKAIEFGLRDLMSEPVQSRTNGYLTFFIAPDGSKEGWEESDAGDQERMDYIAWLDGYRFSDGSSPLDWALLQYGDDEGKTLVMRHDDEVQASDNYKGPAYAEEM